MHSFWWSVELPVSLFFTPRANDLFVVGDVFPCSAKRLIIKIPALISLQHFEYASHCFLMQTEKPLSLHSSPLLRTAFHFRIKKPINPSPSWVMHKWISSIKMSKKLLSLYCFPFCFAFYSLFLYCVWMCVCVHVCRGVCLCEHRCYCVAFHGLMENLAWFPLPHYLIDQMRNRFMIPINNVSQSSLFPPVSRTTSYQSH